MDEVQADEWVDRVTKRLSQALGCVCSPHDSKWRIRRVLADEVEKHSPTHILRMWDIVTATLMRDGHRFREEQMMGKNT